MAFQGEIIPHWWILTNYSKEDLNFQIKKIDSAFSQQGQVFRQFQMEQKAFGKLSFPIENSIKIDAGKSKIGIDYIYIHPEPNLKQKTGSQEVWLYGGIWHTGQAVSNSNQQQNSSNFAIAKIHPVQIKILPSNFQPILFKLGLFQPNTFEQIQMANHFFALILALLIFCSLGIRIFHFNKLTHK